MSRAPCHSEGQAATCSLPAIEVVLAHPPQHTEEDALAAVGNNLSDQAAEHQSRDAILLNHHLNCLDVADRHRGGLGRCLDDPDPDCGGEGMATGRLNKVCQCMHMHMHMHMRMRIPCTYVIGSAARVRSVMCAIGDEWDQ